MTHGYLFSSGSRVERYTVEHYDYNLHIAAASRLSSAHGTDTQAQVP